MNKLFPILIVAGLVPTSPVFGLSNSQIDELRTTVKNMQELLPRRIDAVTTITSTWMKDKTWYINALVNTGGRQPTEKTKNFLRDYVKDQYCRPPFEYLDAGLIITTQYFDENHRFIVSASASKSICGR